MWRVSRDVCFLVSRTEFETLREEDQDGSGDAGHSGHESGSGGPAVLRWKEAASPRSALARGVGGSPLRPWYPHRGSISSASAQVSSRRVLTVAFTQRGSRALQTSEDCNPRSCWQHISATLGGISRNISK